MRVERVVFLAVAVLLGGALVAACAGPTSLDRGAPTPRAAPPGSAGGAPVPPGTGPHAIPGPTSTMPQPVPSIEDPESFRRRQVALAAARGELERAENELKAGARECGGACRALASLERAADHLCDLAVAPEEQTRCREAREKVVRAREMVRSQCGSCAAERDGRSD